MADLIWDVDSFVQEHRRCGELEGGVSEGLVWMACECGATIMRRVSIPLRKATKNIIVLWKRALISLISCGSLAVLAQASPRDRSQQLEVLRRAVAASTFQGARPRGRRAARIYIALFRPARML